MLVKLIAAGVLMVVAGNACAAEDITVRALRLYEKRHYEEAERLLQPEIAAMNDGNRAAASLALGMSFLGSAELYETLYRTALVIELDYLTLLGRQKTTQGSRYADMYLGQVLGESGRHAEAAAHLRKFAALKGLKASAMLQARLEYAADLIRQRQMQKARQELSALDGGGPETRAALAGVYAMAGMTERKPVELADAAARAAGGKRDMRMVRNLLRAYSRSGAESKALELLKDADLGEASVVEAFGNSKTISFYDTSLLEDLSQVHLNAAVMYLEQAGHDEKLAGTASYYLAQAYLLQGNADLAQRNAARALAQEKLPPQTRSIAQASRARAAYMLGKHAEAAAAWEALANTAAEEPALLAVVLMSCTQSGAECGKLEKRSLALADKGEGKRYFPLYAALGKYYLREKKYASAFQYLEAGRDKANKNKIEANDPLLLVNLAEACYRNKKFSENLEIYFELGKQFPVVRQIQDAMQGIYAMEHRSAGEVKIF